MIGLAQDAITCGIRNLLNDCADLKAGDELLIIHEDPNLGWYDEEAPQAVAREARALGMNVRFLKVGAPGNEPDPTVEKAMESVDCSLFFARIGDQDRFDTASPARKKVMCYARKVASLASPFGTTPHAAMLVLKEAVNTILRQTKQVEITCALGTRVGGPVHKSGSGEPEDVTMLRFPVGVPMPLGAEAFDGIVVLNGYLTPTGSKVYEPAFVKIGQPVDAHVEQGRIVRFEGQASDVAAIEAHYQSVSKQFSIDPMVVHSWHAGIHPGCTFDSRIQDDPDLWSNSIFQNPRYLHFHTCGAYPPGEICWMIQDPTILLDGTPLWKDGVLQVQSFPSLEMCLVQWPPLEALFAHPGTAVGR